MSFRRSSSTCLYFHRAEARAVNHLRIDRRLLSLLSLPACTICISLNAFSVTTHTSTTLCVIHIFTIPFGLATDARIHVHAQNEYEFLASWKLSNGFSVLSSMCFITGQLVICKTLFKRSTLVQKDGLAMDHHAIEWMSHYRIDRYVILPSRDMRIRIKSDKIQSKFEFLRSKFENFESR